MAGVRIKNKERKIYKCLIWTGRRFSCKCKSGEMYSASAPYQKVDVFTKEDYEELINNALLCDYFIIVNDNQ